jgi:hypothetical protein
MNEDGQIQLIVDTLKDNYSIFRDNVWKLAGSGLIAVGWIMTSDHARNFLLEYKSSRFILIGTFIMAGIAHCVVNYRMVIKSQALIERLADKIDRSIINNYTITIGLYILNAIAVLCILVSGIVLVAIIKK